MKTTRIFVVAVCALALCLTAGAAQAAVISFNLRSDGGSSTAMLSTDTAGAPGVNDDNWNDVLATQTGGTTLAAGTIVDGDGATVSGLAFSATSPQHYTSNAFQGAAGGSGDAKMLHGGFDIANIAGSDLNFSLTGIPLASYDVYVYAAPGQFSNRGGDVWLNGYTTGSLKSVRQHGPNAGFVGYVESTSAFAFNDPATDQGTYVKFSGVTGSSFTLDMETGPSSRHPIAGIQIVGDFGGGGGAVPEPSALVIAGIGLLGLLACGRRRNRRRA